MSYPQYNFDNFSDAIVAENQTNALLSNKNSGGDNAFVIINNMGLTNITFISASIVAGPGSYAILADKQVGDVLLVYGSLTTQAQHDAGWKSAVEGQSPRTAKMNWKVVTSNDVSEVITGSADVSYAAILRPNASIRRVTVNDYTPEALQAMRTISYSGSLYTQKKPAIAFAYYTSVGSAFQDYTKQFSAEVGNGDGDQNSMSYLQPPVGLSTTAYAKIRTYDSSGSLNRSLRDMNVQYNAGQTTLYYGSLHFE